MKDFGKRGTYRESILGKSVEKILCSVCCLSKFIKNGQELNYELWYKTDIKGNALWAYNTEHIDQLIKWLSSDMMRKNSDSYLETLPKWMITNIIKVVEKLKQLKNK